MASPGSPLLRGLRRLAGALPLLGLLGLGLIVVIPALLGYQRYVIVSGSMTGTYDRGSLVLDEVVPVSSLREGDVITYRPPRGSGPTGLVTHRIVSISRDRDGTPVYRTKGDANAVADPWTFNLRATHQARVKLGIPNAGFAVAALSERRWRMLIVGLPAAFIAFLSLSGLWREAGADVERARAPARTEA
jgi:signal peptidase